MTNIPGHYLEEYLCQHFFGVLFFVFGFIRLLWLSGFLAFWPLGFKASRLFQLARLLDFWAFLASLRNWNVPPPRPGKMCTPLPNS